MAVSDPVECPWCGSALGYDTEGGLWCQFVLTCGWHRA